MLILIKDTLVLEQPASWLDPWGYFYSYVADDRQHQILINAF